MERKPAALIVPASLGESVILGRLDTDPAALRRLVGGDVESISRGDWHVYLNARGMILNMQPNIRAAQLAHDAGLDIADAARGTAVFLGNAGPAAESDVPAYLSRRARELFGTPLAA
ncbi:hypothetical protein AB4068_15285 [Arthrobacter sp. 2RAF22]|uniref:DUF3846 domain-containing protein n=1 Tax=Arthrobacter sp. 2RAF22 TaxID=3232996 RepID=UPI003F8FDE90